MPKFDIDTFDLNDIERLDTVDAKDIRNFYDEAKAMVDDWESWQSDEPDRKGTDEWREWEDDRPCDEEEAQAAEHVCTLLSDIVDDLPDDDVLISEDHFPQYARETADSTIADFDDSQWPYTCIDWDHAADELKHDYSGIEIGETTFYYRS